MSDPKTAQITLGDTTFTVRRLNLDELQEIMEATEALPHARLPLAILKIALRRSDPPVAEAEVGKLEATTDQLHLGCNAVMTLAGMKPEKENPPVPGQE